MTGSGPEELERLRRRTADLEAQLAQSQKLHTIGALAAGIAHDFNNLLTAILGHASLLDQDAPATGAVRESLNAILGAAERASQLTNQLLRFARPGKCEPERVDIHQTLAELRGLLRHTIDKRIVPEGAFLAPSAVVMGDPGQLFQVFLNLALNARDAMPDGGRLTFRTRASGGWLVVEVEDSGHGIPEDVRGRIFDPFFTTKGAKGAGMGLAVARTVVEGHRGSIEVESRPGEGTVFRVSLPLAEGAHAAPEPEAAPPPDPDLGDVLVVDDEDVVRQVVARMLAQLGRRAVCFGGCHEALDHFRRRHKAVGFIVLDMVMPEMTGRECFERLRAIDPEAKVLISSGFGRDAAVEALLAQGGAGFLEKPYRLGQLRRAIAALLT